MKEISIDCILPRLFKLVQELSEELDDRAKIHLKDKFNKFIQTIPKGERIGELLEFASESAYGLTSGYGLTIRIEIEAKQYTFDWAKSSSTSFKLKSIINDLSNKKFYIDRNIDYFNNNRNDFMENSKKEDSPKQYTQELMDCYLFFESFLYQSQAFLDVLVKFYAEILNLIFIGIWCLEFGICRLSSCQGNHQVDIQ